MVARAGNRSTHRHYGFVPVWSDIRSIERLTVRIGTRLDITGTLYSLVSGVGATLALYRATAPAGRTGVMIVASFSKHSSKKKSTAPKKLFCQYSAAKRGNVRSAKRKKRHVGCRNTNIFTSAGNIKVRRHDEECRPCNLPEHTSDDLLGIKRVKLPRNAMPKTSGLPPLFENCGCCLSCMVLCFLDRYSCLRRNDGGESRPIRDALWYGTELLLP